MQSRVRGAVHYLFILAWLIFFGLLLYFFQRWLDTQNNPNRHIATHYQVGGAKELVLRANRQHHYVAPGKINGVSVTFLLDTGASGISVPERVAKQAGLVGSYPVQAQTANGTVIVYLTRIKRLTLGPFELSNIAGNINPKMQGRQVLLGMSGLKQFELIQRNGHLVLRLHE